MTRLIAFGLGIASLAGGATPVLAQGNSGEAWRREAAQHGWRTRFPGAREEARRSDKPMMIVLRCIP